MNGLQVILMVFVGALGALIGMIAELMVDNKIITDLQEQNRKLTLENAQLRREVKHEVIEIVDNRTTDEVKFGGF